MPTTQQLQEINDDVKDIINTNFEFSITDARTVPRFDDPSLTFETNRTKRGKMIETCVLYIDIRNSTELSNKHQKETMGKLYTAFTKSMIYAAEFHQGLVRNIIGDRVMIVFPPNNSFKNAVNCAITMNTIASKIINKHFKLNEFKCGIGIDYGNMLVLKTGIAKHGTERSPFKNLVWIGKPANIASKLTDIANKKIKRVKFDIRYWGYTYNPFFGFSSPLFPKISDNKKFKYEIIEKTIKGDEFLSQVKWDESTKKLVYGSAEIVNFRKIEEEITMPSILMTERVYNNYKRENPTASDILKNSWTTQTADISQYNGQIFGASLHWSNIKTIQI